MMPECLFPLTFLSLNIGIHTEKDYENTVFDAVPAFPKGRNCNSSLEFVMNYTKRERGLNLLFDCQSCIRRGLVITDL